MTCCSLWTGHAAEWQTAHLHSFPLFQEELNDSQKQFQLLLQELIPANIFLWFDFTLLTLALFCLWLILFPSFSNKPWAHSEGCLSKDWLETWNCILVPQPRLNSTGSYHHAAAGLHCWWWLHQQQHRQWNGGCDTRQAVPRARGGATHQWHQSSSGSAWLTDWGGWGKAPARGPPEEGATDAQGGWAQDASLLTLAPNTPGLIQYCLRWKSFQTKQTTDCSIFFHSSLITEYSPINLIKTLQSLFSSGEFSPLFPKNSFWMYCQERAFSVLFQVAWNNKELSLQLRSGCTI